MTSLQDIAQVAFIGIGATAVMDVWPRCAAVCSTDDGYGYVIMPLARDR